MKIDKYKDNFYIRFEQGGDVWAGISKLPHYKVWRKILNHLQKRGFEIKTSRYFTEQKYGETLHKWAQKDNVVFTLECMGNQIKVEYGDIKNLWKEEYNFWSLSDSRSTLLSYLEYKKIQMEVNKLLSIFPQEIIKNNNMSVLSPEEKIIRDKKDSCHSRDISKLDELGLGGVVYQMSQYDLDQNSNDKNGKRINCGELKYYYNRRKLMCGRVYHQLNNRWFVLSGGELDYVSSWELFDFDNQSRRKELTKEEKINRLESELKRYENKKDYLRCISINKTIEKLKAKENIYNVWSLKHSAWWGANNNGYTEDKKYAGVYLEENILSNQGYYNNGSSTKAVLIG